MKRKSNEAHKIKRNNKKAVADLRDLKCIFLFTCRNMATVDTDRKFLQKK